MGELGASCFHTLSDKERDVSKPEWERQRVGMICTSSDSFSNWKEVILKFCAESRKCTYEMEQEVKKFSSRVEKRIIKK